jgi:dTDP-4-amino-4,6-dideoxygalactose transaminase
VDQPIRENYLIFGSPQILEPEIQAVVATLHSGWIGTGPRVAKFEQTFRDYVGANYVMAVNSCTAALHLALVVIGLEPKDEVIVPSMTFAASANTVIHAGGRPVLADVDRQTMCLDLEDVARRVTPRTRAIMPVHFAGRPGQMDALLELAASHSLRVIEDCAHAIETLYDGRHAGTLGDIGAFSVYVTKNVITGEGGMATTSDPKWADRIKIMALHGLSADAWKRFFRCGIQALRGHGAGVQVQHDGPTGRSRASSVGASGGQSPSPPADLAAL